MLIVSNIIKPKTFTGLHSHSQRSCPCRLIPFDSSLVILRSLSCVWQVRLIKVFVYFAFHKTKIQPHCLFLLLKQIAVTKLQKIITFSSSHTFPPLIRTDLPSSAHLLSMTTPLTNRPCIIISLSAFLYFLPKCLPFSLRFHSQPYGYEALMVSTYTAFGMSKSFLPFILHSLLWSFVSVSTKSSLWFFQHPAFSTSSLNSQNRKARW